MTGDNSRADTRSTARASTTEKRLGAHWLDNRCEFRVWAPDADAITVHLEGSGKQLPLRKDEDGYFSGVFAEVHVGDLYRYSIDGEVPLPDPCSRYQPAGPHGASMVVDTRAFAWSDHDWQGINLHGQVIYELHIGTFTPEGTFDAALARLPHLKTLGVTCIEVMPIAEWAGSRNWGYDGVCLFAPTHCYGDYDAFKRFVDRAHALGLAVILDVVYNHLGPDGNYLAQYSKYYFSTRHTTEWGEPLNFDGEQCHGMRHLIISNACEWVREFHLDGLRLDATQSIHDDSKPRVLAELTEAVRRTAAPRSIILVAENEPQRASHLLAVAQGGLGFDGMWNDDFHHSAYVAATGRREAYYSDYTGNAQEFIATAKHGFLFQGQFFQWQKQPRGEPLQTALSSCISFLENHDQVANSMYGQRLVQMTSEARYRALTALWLLLPQTPMLFMGQEFASSPFLFFVDHRAPLSKDVATGRKQFLSQFPDIASDGDAVLADPGDLKTFERCKLNWQELEARRHWLQLHIDLLALRRNDPVIAAQGSNLDGAPLNTQAFVLRWFDAAHGDRLLLVNLGVAVPVQGYAEPLLASPPQRQWAMQWSSAAADYGGSGRIDPLTQQGWQLPAESAVLFAAITV